MGILRLYLTEKDGGLSKSSAAARSAMRRVTYLFVSKVSMSIFFKIYLFISWKDSPFKVLSLKPSRPQVLYLSR